VASLSEPIGKALNNCFCEFNSANGMTNSFVVTKSISLPVTCDVLNLDDGCRVGLFLPATLNSGAAKCRVISGAAGGIC
jgi:hypothetical protein